MGPYFFRDEILSCQVGDTGCRLDMTHAPQACNNDSDWAFSRVANNIAAGMGPHVESVTFGASIVIGLGLCYVVVCVFGTRRSNIGSSAYPIHAKTFVCSASSVHA